MGDGRAGRWPCRTKLRACSTPIAHRVGSYGSKNQRLAHKHRGPSDFTPGIDPGQITPSVRSCEPVPVPIKTLVLKVRAQHMKGHL